VIHKTTTKERGSPQDARAVSSGPWILISKLATVAAEVNLSLRQASLRQTRIQDAQRARSLIYRGASFEKKLEGREEHEVCSAAIANEMILHRLFW
jgi:hypothetical protein